MGDTLAELSGFAGSEGLAGAFSGPHDTASDDRDYEMDDGYEQAREDGFL
jgi:hypothetical protein